MAARHVLVLAWVLVVMGCIESNPQPSPLHDTAQQADTNAENPDTGGPGTDVKPELDGLVTEDIVSPDLTGDTTVDVAADVMDDETGGLPTGCCEKDADCKGENSFCYLSGSTLGVCLPKPGADECWSNQQCAEGKLCLGPVVCGCGSTCPIEQRIGLCVSEGFPCCETDDQCPSSLKCLAVTFNGGKKGKKCLAEAPETGCWNNDDCDSGAVCADYYIKQCSEPTIGGDVAGICAPFQSNCCSLDEDCGWGKVCVAATKESEGVCQNAPAYPSCYSDAECGGLGSCVGGLACGCESDCVSQLGTCEQFDPCCKSDADCDPGLVCVAAGVAGGGLCLPPPGEGQCFRQEDCGGESVCLDQALCGCAMNCISAAGACQALPDGCCKFADACPAGQQCVFPFGGQQEEVGVCRDWPEEGSCWTGETCGAEEVCVGAVVCPCGQTCETESQGLCLPASQDICCTEDADCPVGWTCVQGKNPICKPLPPAGSCWDKTDCGLAQACDFVQLCECGQECPFEDQMGTCNNYMPWGCCITDYDCKDGSHCVPMGPGKLGRCMWSDQWSSGCWEDADCPEGQTCNGEFICGCEEYCNTYEMQGQCGSPPPEGCCYSAMDCPTGQSCTGDAGNAGSCVPKAEFGQCWSAGDCYWSQSCQGAVKPACGELVVPEVGECSPMPSNCCWKDSDCTAGRVCRYQGYVPTDLPGMCMWDPKGPACPAGQLCCWNDSDCPAEHWCSGSQGCACLEICQGCGTCSDIKVGTCIPWGGGWDLPLPKE